MTLGSTPVGGVYIPIDGDNRGFRRELRESERVARTSTGKIRREFGHTTQSVESLNRSIMGTRTSMLALGAAAGIAVTAATRVLANFGQAMSTVRAVTGATESQFGALEAKARELGASTRFSATQAADGMTFLARAGFNVDQVLGSIEGTLKLAQSGNLQLADAADIASNVLKGMGLEVSETARVVDVLSRAANSSNTNVRQLGDALKYVAPIAAGLGVGLEETTAAVGALSDAGLQGEMAGTGLRKVMISLEKQSKEGKDILAKYGLSMEDVSVSANGLIPALHKLAAAGISTGEAMTLFGLRGGPASEVLVNTLRDVERLEKKLDEAAGTAEHIATVMDDNLNGALLRARSAMEELILAIGEAGATDALISSFNGLANMLRIAAENADLAAIAFVALATRALLPMAVAYVGPLILKIGALSNMLLLIAQNAGIATAASTALGGAMAAINPLTAVIIAAAAAFYAVHKDAERAREAVQGVEMAIEAAGAAMAATDQYDTFKEIGESAKLTIPIFNQVRDAVKEVAQALNDTTIAGFISEAQQVYNALNQAQSALAAITNEQEIALSRQVNDPTLTRSERVSVARQLGYETKFDDDVRRASQQVAILEARLGNIGKNVFGEVNILEAFQKGGLDEVETVLRDRLKKFQTESSAALLEAASASAGGGKQSSDSLGAFSEDVLGDGFGALNGPAGTDPLVIKQQAEALRLYNEASKTAFDLELARLDLRQAMAGGDDAAVQAARDRVAELEKALFIEQTIADLQNRGLGLEDATRIAGERANELGSRGGFADGTNGPSLEGQKAEFRQVFTSAFQQAMTDGNVGEAIKSVFAQRAADGLNDALNSIADLVFDLFSGVFDGIGGGSGGIGDIFGGIGSLFSFGGSRASGGSVSGGSRYLVGERGPEMFVPSSDGLILPNEAISMKNMPAVAGGTKNQINMGDIIVQGDASESTLRLIREEQAAQAERLPSMIDARVRDSAARGRI